MIGGLQFIYITVIVHLDYILIYYISIFEYMLEAVMKENIALLLAILYLIYRYKTYKKVNKTIEDRIENVHKLFFKRIQHALQCSEEEAEKVDFSIR